MDPEAFLHFKLALISFQKLTPFAYLAAFGALLAVGGAAITLLAGKALGLEEAANRKIKYLQSDLEGREAIRLNPRAGRARPKFGDPLFWTWVQTIPILENGYMIFLLGVVLFGVGLYPFVAAAP